MKILLLFLMIFSFASVLAQHPDDYRWDDRFSKPGISNPEFNGAPIRGALALAANNDYVIVGGRFTVPGNNIALWNKRTLSWEQAGSGVWKNPSQFDYPEVRGLVAIGDTVFVSGKFTSAGNIPADGFATFNTRTKVWSADTLFAGSISTVNKIGGGRLLVSGAFTIKGTSIRNQAFLDNGQWTEFSNDTTMLPLAIQEYKGALYSNVYYTINKVYALSRWTGTTWVPIFTKIYSTISPYITFKTSKEYIYVLGSIDSMETSSGAIVRGGGMLRWDGNNWTTLVDSIFIYNVSVLTIDNNDIYVAGEFSSIQGYNANRIAKWDHTTERWSGLGSGINGDEFGAKINALIVSDNQVYAAGQFATAGSQNVNNIARYDVSTFTWYPLGDAKTQAPNIIGGGNAFVFNDNDRLLVTGDFEYAGDKRLNSIGYWNGKAWENAGTGILGGAGYTYTGTPRMFIGPTGLTAFARVGTKMYLGGTFEQLGAYSCENITSYDNGITECVGGGLRQSHIIGGSGYFVPASVSALIGIGSNLYAAGDFTRAGSLPVESIAQWDGSTWSNMGGGIRGGVYTSNTFAIDSSYLLLVAGDISRAGTAACNGLASWNGKEWKAIGYTPGDSGAVVNALCVAPNGEIWIAGYLSSAGYKGPGSLMRLVGDRLELVTEIFQKGMNTGGITVMACKGDLLYVAGGFDHIGGIQANNVAVYNMKTQKWSALGSGFVKTTTQDTVTYSRVSVQTIAFIGDTVYFGGTFSYAGGKPSFCIAAWLPAKSNSVEYLGDVQSTHSTLTCSPNPATTQLNFRVQFVRNGHSTLTISDALGRIVHTVSDEYRTAGEYSMTASTDALPTGVYYARLVTGGTVVTIPVSVIH